MQQHQLLDDIIDWYAKYLRSRKSVAVYAAMSEECILTCRTPQDVGFPMVFHCVWPALHEGKRNSCQIR